MEIKAGAEKCIPFTMKDTMIRNFKLSVIGWIGYWSLTCYDQMQFLNIKRPQSFLEKDAL
ncbi:MULTISPECIES: hypothetical protein [Bacillus cereus group]|uniref:hypothetical protein n=1 Tax=Bacillus cereus group TaxID=86661 RepID=UPI000B434FA6|nr:MULTISPECIES: hypothetical protein [Bacillus cereus group]MCU5063152.1 hypothetical protein [Bacillus cereus]MDA2518642.1 hypothetical protein [Bacillus cereus]MEB8692951.1 hypothetical protein [Bacillus cereus]OTX80827.1 hypothetical protein BK726_27550 [Bacillus thuringiensis serovar londrina]PFT54333.1 hypothetical protein COK67_29110 [Bacillus cereus]